MLKAEFQLMALNILRDANNRCSCAYTQEQRIIITRKMGEELEELRIAWNKLMDERITMPNFKKGVGIPM